MAWRVPAHQLIHVVGGHGLWRSMMAYASRQVTWWWWWWCMLLNSHSSSFVYHYRAVRYGPIPLGWYVNQDLQNRRGADWSNQKCREWHDADSKDTTWLKELPPCPCTLQQALADFGRWQADPGCNLFTGSQCTFHQGSKHCVRSVAATWVRWLYCAPSTKRVPSVAL